MEEVSNAYPNREQQEPNICSCDPVYTNIRA